MQNSNSSRSLFLWIVSAGIVFVGFAPQAPAQSNPGPTCTAVDPDRCNIETFDGASSGNKGTSWTSPKGWQFDVLNYVTNINVQTGYTDFGTAVKIGCDTTKIELPNDPIRYVTFLVNGDTPGQGRMDILAVDNNGDIVDQAYRFNADSHGAEAVYLGPIDDNDPALDKTVIHTIRDPNVACQPRCSKIFIGEIRACGTPTTN